MTVRRAGPAAAVCTIAAGVLCAAVAGAAAPPSSTSPTTAPSTTVVASTTAPTTPTTTPATTTPVVTTTAPPANPLAGVAWIQLAYTSPCSDTSVQMVGGAAVDGASLAVLDDVVPLDAPAGLAVAFLSCHSADGSTIESTASLVKVASGRASSVAEQELGPGARVVAVDLPSIVVEAPDGVPVDGSCCTALVRRRTYEASIEGFSMVGDEQVATILQTVAPPAVGGDGDLVRSSVPAEALCYRWDNVYLSPPDPAAAPPPVASPSAELQTVRLALVHVTGRWITPSSVMTSEMSDVVRAYQEARGLVVDGQVGAETTSALSTDLGCTTAGEFRQIVPIGIGPRRFASISDLLVVMDRYGRSGSTGNASLTGLLADARWDAASSLFLGCYRWDNPPAGMSCSWSGRTPLQLIGLVDDPTAPGITSFSVLYARSAG